MMILDRGFRRSEIVVASVVLLLLAGNLYQLSVIQEQGEELADTRSDLSVTKKVLNTTQAALESAHAENDQLRAELDAREETIRSLGQRLGLVEERVEELTPVVRRFAAIGVSESGEGVVIPLEVKLVAGTGDVSVNIQKVDLLAGVQDSVRTSVAVADGRTSMRLGEQDITISFVNEGEDVVTMDGGSAGSAITTLIIAAADNRTLDEDVLMTGTIESDGSIGKVGSIRDKAEAARDFGAAVFLVPDGQSTTVSGIRVIEVDDIGDALNRALD